MRKQEIFVLFITLMTWAVTIGGRPFIGLLYYHIFRTLEYQVLFVKLRTIKIPFVTSALLIFSLIFKKRKIVLSDQARIMIILCGIVFISRIANGLELFGHKYVVFLCKNVIFHILIINLIDTEKKLKAYLWTFILSGAAVAAVARYHDMSVAYYWMNKNDFATDLIPACAFILYLLVSEKKLLLKAEAFVYSIIILYGIIGTNSRGGYLALGTVVALLAIKNLLPIGKMKLKQAILLLLVFGVVLARVSDAHWERFFSIKKEATEQRGTAGQRIAAWKVAVKMIEANPMFGIGTGEFTYCFDEYASVEELEAAGGAEINTHNTILQIAAENGIPGFFLMTLIFLLSFKDLLRASSLCGKNPGLMGLGVMVDAIGVALVGFLTAGLFANKAYNFPLYTLTALTFVARGIAEKKYRTENGTEEKEREERNSSDRVKIGVRSIVFALAAYIGIFN
jgi:O-antigen ligase